MPADPDAKTINLHSNEPLPTALIITSSDDGVGHRGHRVLGLGYRRNMPVDTRPSHHDDDTDADMRQHRRYRDDQ
jgi:hypothetical protein